MKKIKKNQLIKMKKKKMINNLPMIKLTKKKLEESKLTQKEDHTKKKMMKLNWIVNLLLNTLKIYCRKLQR